MKLLQTSLAALALTGTLAMATMAPAAADSAASTRNIILGAAAIAGIAIEANVAKKNAQARNINGYLGDGSAVYGDGRVVDRNGNTYYPGNNGQSVNCSNGSCYVTRDGGNTNRGYGNGNSGYATANRGYSDARATWTNNGRGMGPNNERDRNGNDTNGDRRNGNR